MPGRKHLNGVSDKEVAARTVMKYHSKRGHPTGE